MEEEVREGDLCVSVRTVMFAPASGLGLNQAAIYEAVPRKRDRRLYWRFVKLLGTPHHPLDSLRVGALAAKRQGLIFRPEVRHRMLIEQQWGVATRQNGAATE